MRNRGFNRQDKQNGNPKVMRSGSTLRNYGSWMLSPQELARPEDALVAGKLAAILLGACALGVVFALFPIRAPAGTRADLLAVALVLAVQGLAYALGVARQFVSSLLMSLLAVPLLALARPEPLALGAFAALAVLCCLLEFAVLRRQRRLVAPLAALVLPTLVALGVLAPSFGIIAAGLVMAMAPLASAFLPVSRLASIPEEATSTPRDAALPALLAAALSPEGRVVLVCDTMGLVDKALTPARPEAAQPFPGGSLTEATLIADRVALLQMLAQTAREGRASKAVVLRLRQGPLGAGYPAPGHFESCQLRAFPLPGYPGRAAVLIEAEAYDTARQVAHVATPQPRNTALLARALHDGLAPFNAGLGFLEMVADPRLAPRDFTALHDFTSEAHKAMCEAHRNSVLLGLWLRLTQDEAHAATRGETGARRLFTEALRLLNLEDMEKRGDLVASESFDNGQSYALSLHAARFALAVLLRFGLGAAHVDLDMKEEGADLLFIIRRKEGGEHAVAVDTFQQALEQAAMTRGECVFEAAGQGARQLRLCAVAATRRVSDTLRLAS
jgi:hypothetical protein